MLHRTRLIQISAVQLCDFALPRTSLLTLGPVGEGAATNRVFILSTITTVLFFIMSMPVGIDVMLRGETS